MPTVYDKKFAKKILRGVFNTRNLEVPISVLLESPSALHRVLKL